MASSNENDNLGIGVVAIVIGAIAVALVYSPGIIIASFISPWLSPLWAWLISIIISYILFFSLYFMYYSLMDYSILKWSIWTYIILSILSTVAIVYYSPSVYSFRTMLDLLGFDFI